MRGEAVDWDDLFDGLCRHRRLAGRPFWREISAAFPDAIVLLSTLPRRPTPGGAARTPTIFEADAARWARRHVARSGPTWSTQ